MKKLISTFTSIILLVLSKNLSAQTEVIEIDSITRAAVRTAPYDKPFLIKAQIDAESVKSVFLIKKHRNNTLDNTISYYIKKNGGAYYPEKFEKNYFWTRKIGDKNHLFISIADKYLFKPSESYFIIPDLRQTDPAAIAFFDLYYQSILPGNPNAAIQLPEAVENLTLFESQMRKIYSKKLDFGFMTLKDFTRDPSTFATDFNNILLPSYRRYQLSKTIFNDSLTTRATRLINDFPSFDSLTYAQLLNQASLNKDAVNYLAGKDYIKNDAISDFNSLLQGGQTNNLLSGASSLNCIYCEKADISSNAVKDLNKRISNVDSSVKQLNILQRSLYLLKPKETARSNIATSITRANTWLRELLLSKDSLTLMLKQRKKIEDIIMDSVFVGKMFTYTQVLTGNTYMNFETRNKVLLTPDFGIVTSALTPEGKKFEYGIIPYLGFHINMMAVDKDITFKSYKKHPLQYFSVMVGWSLVNMNQEASYANFFEKSSLLTGVGFRLNNVLRITTGANWFFKLGTDANNNPTRNLRAVPYVGLSFDLNIKQYLNGFVDILSGIGKTNPSISTNTTNSQ